MSKEIKNKCVNALYAGLKFGNYNNPEKNTVLKYELDNIISGKDSDKENLASVVEKIVLAKTGINMAYLITDKEKNGTGVSNSSICGNCNRLTFPGVGGKGSAN